MHHSAPILTELDGIAHGFFTRKGGVSTGIYESLNCGPGSKDDPAHVSENRRRAMEELDAGHASFCTLHQIHSNKVVAVRVPWSDHARPQADAMVTREPDIAIGVLTADCGPVLFADADAGVIGAAHAGRGGAILGILEQTIDAMESLGAQRSRMVAVLGPCLLQPHHEVGPEIYEQFATQDALYGTFFKPSGKAEHFLFDLQGFILHRLAQSGLKSAESLAMDTYSNEAEFFSYRRTTHRGEPDYGRQLSAIMIRGETE